MAILNLHCLYQGFVDFFFFFFFFGGGGGSSFFLGGGVTSNNHCGSYHISQRLVRDERKQCILVGEDITLKSRS